MRSDATRKGANCTGKLRACALSDSVYQLTARPWRVAAITASARVETPSAVKMACACCLTVFGAIASSAAMRSLL